MKTNVLIVLLIALTVAGIGCNRVRTEEGVTIEKRKLADRTLRCSGDDDPCPFALAITNYKDPGNRQLLIIVLTLNEYRRIGNDLSKAEKVPVKLTLEPIHEIEIDAPPPYDRVQPKLPKQMAYHIKSIEFPIPRYQ
jgi:hypothetical protein